MAFIVQSPGQASREEKREQIMELARQYLDEEPPLDRPKPGRAWRASDIKNACPRQVYYSRYASHHASGQITSAAVYGTAVHTMFQHGAPEDEDVWDAVFSQALQEYGARGLDDPNISWKSSAKPFSLAGFAKASPEAKAWTLYERYLGLDRVNYNYFWDTYPFAIYRHPPTGRLGQEQRLKATVDGQKISTTADLIITDVYTGEIGVVDWKTGRASEPTQLATYAMAAEEFYGLEPGSIEKGYFVLTGTGECVAPRGKLPERWKPDPENSVQVEDLAPWRKVVSERLFRLRKREETGVWTPKLNALCYSTCEFRFVCPIGKAVQDVKQAENPTT